MSRADTELRGPKKKQSAHAELSQARATFWERKAQRRCCPLGPAARYNRRLAGALRRRTRPRTVRVAVARLTNVALSRASRITEARRTPHTNVTMATRGKFVNGEDRTPSPATVLSAQSTPPVGAAPAKFLDAAEGKKRAQAALDTR